MEKKILYKNWTSLHLSLQNSVHPLCFLQIEEEEAHPLHLPAALQPPVHHRTLPPQDPCSPPPLDNAIGLPPPFASLSLFLLVVHHLTRTRSLTPTRNRAVPLQCRSFHQPHSLHYCLLKNSALQGSWLTYLGLEHSKERQWSSHAL